MPRKLKKTLCLLTAVFQCCIFCLGAAPVIEALTTEENSAEMLFALGIIDERKELDNLVTRAEYARLIVGLLGLQEIVSDDTRTSPFVDVEINNSYAGDISLLYKLGCIFGDDKSRFYPEHNITYQEAVVVLVHALGYRQVAIEKGGYPVGYLIVANDLGILSKTDYASESEMTYGMTYALFARCLEAVPKDCLIDSLKNASTLLEAYHGIKKEKGVVTGNAFTTLGETHRGMVAGRLQVDGTDYHVDGTAFSQCLGMQVEYYRGIRDDNEDMVYFVSAYKNTSTEIKAREVIASNGGELRYYDSTGREATLLLSNSCDVVYNDKFITGYGTIDQILPDTGILKGIDRDNDSLVDVLFISKYDSFMVGSVDTSTKTLYDKYTSRAMVLEDAQCDTAMYQEDGSELLFSDIKPGMLLSITETRPSQGKVLRKIYVSTGKAEGQIVETSEKNGTAYTINGASYYLSESYETAMEQNSSLRLAVGDEGIFYLDIEGNIAGASFQSNENMLYAVLAGAELKTGISNQLNLKLFAQNGESVQTTLEEKYRIDGIYRSALTNDDVNSMKNLIGTVVRFRLKENGSLAEIDTCEAGPAKGIKLLKEGDSVRYRNNMINGQVALNKETVIFSCPEDLLNEADYGIISTAAFEPGISQTVQFRAYCYGDSEINLASAIVVSGISAGKIQATSPCYMITNVRTALDENGERAELIRCLRNNSYEDFYAAEVGFCSENSLKTGDVIRAVRDNQGKVRTVEKVFDCAGGNSTINDSTKPINTNIFDAQYVVLCAEVQKIENGFLKYKTAAGTEGIFALGSAKADCFRKDTRKFESLAPATLAAGTKFVVRTHLGIAQEIFVYQ